MEVQVARLTFETVEVGQETLDEIADTQRAYTTIDGDACYVIEGKRLGLEPGQGYFMWGL